MSAATTPWPLWQRFLIPLLVLLLAWELLPTLDHLVSGWAYRSDGSGFWLRETLPAMVVYKGTHYLTVSVVLGLLAVIGYGLASAEAARRSLARRAGLTLLAIAIGPGFVVHTVLKDHWGRPRPAQTAEFGGSGQYVAPGVPSQQCARNCSFTSGHAAAGYLLMMGGLLWPAQRRRWLWIGLCAGSAFGAVRIIQGAHYFSDVLGSGLITFATLSLVEKLALKQVWLEPALSKR